MTRYDCLRCQSAGSVNQWGCCEICGEDIKDVEFSGSWMTETSKNRDSALAQVTEKDVTMVLETDKSVAIVEQDAA